MELKVPKAGQPITESFLRALVAKVEARVLGGKNVRVERKPGGLVIHSADGGASGAPRWQPYNGE